MAPIACPRCGKRRLNPVQGRCSGCDAEGVLTEPWLKTMVDSAKFLQSQSDPASFWHIEGAFQPAKPSDEPVLFTRETAETAFCFFRAHEVNCCWVCVSTYGQETHSIIFGDDEGIAKGVALFRETTAQMRGLFREMSLQPMQT